MTEFERQAAKDGSEALWPKALKWENIKSIVQIADRMLDDPKARMEYNNHNKEKCPIRKTKDDIDRSKKDTGTVQ